MTEQRKIQEFLVVEGRSDTENLQRFFEVDTIETGGSALNEACLERIRLAVAGRGAIVLTDPDFNGQRLRQKIAQAVPGIKSAFINQDQGRAAHDNPHKSLGVEHASQAALLAALDKVVTPKEVAQSDLDLIFMNDLGLVGRPDSKQRRLLLGEKLHIGYGNGKQFLKRLQAFGFDRAAVEEAIEEIKW
ncbi:ribonuclease M5 [Eupransor demetentiae]|uniref:Ribonuclease M5 n=1 Tax=Eupransor demetentiae TaxID=3109584 RepID=A0ABP0EN67_9LACO|nr:5S rRNA maturation ribonuclease M5 [Lactobacillaceae bacterium LMG 33000]